MCQLSVSVSLWSMRWTTKHLANCIATEKPYDQWTRIYVTTKHKSKVKDDRGWFSSWAWEALFSLLTINIYEAICLFSYYISICSVLVQHIHCMPYPVTKPCCTIRRINLFSLLIGKPIENCFNSSKRKLSSRKFLFL